MGQSIGEPIDDTIGDSKNQQEQSPIQLQLPIAGVHLPIAEELSEEEYYSESASSEEQEAQESFTPDHTI